MPARQLRTAPTKPEPSSSSDLASLTSPPRRRSSRASGKAPSPLPVAPSSKKSSPTKSTASSTDPSPSKQSNAQRKLATFRANFSSSPFPDLVRPTPEDAAQVAELLRSFHGYSKLPQKAPPRGEDRFGGCGDVASVLDALIRTVLSCNTSNKNSAAAHRSLCERFGKAQWEAIHRASQAELADSIRCGGLHERKARIIKGILSDVQAKYGKLSLDHLHSPSLTTDDIMAELLGFDGVGPKVASCVVAFCIGREECAVDTHVYRLSKKLGWVPEKASRDQTYYHLAARLPPHLKFPLHTLLIKHGKRCDDCSARGFATERQRLDGSSSTAADASAKKEEGGETKVKVKKEEQGDSGESEESSDERAEELDSAGKRRKCPLREAGLFGKRGGKMKKEEEGGSGGMEGDVKEERAVKGEVEEKGADGLSPSSEPRAGKRARTAIMEETQEDADVGNAKPGRSSPRKRVKSEVLGW